MQVSIIGILESLGYKVNNLNSERDSRQVQTYFDQHARRAFKHANCNYHRLFYANEEWCCYSC